MWLPEEDWRIDAHHHAKFYWNWSIHSGDMRFFDISKWPPPSWILEITLFYWLTVSAGSRHITVPYFVKIGQSLVKILQFVDYSGWRQPPSWIFEVAKFYWLTTPGGSSLITVQNCVIIGISVADILQLFEILVAPLARCEVRLK